MLYFTGEVFHRFANQNLGHIRVMLESCTTLQVKNSLEIALSDTVFEIFTLLHFPQKSKMATKTGKK